MKDIYEKPVSELEKFDDVDVITASTGSDVGGDDNGAPWPFG